MLRSAERAATSLESPVDVPQEATFREKLRSALGAVWSIRQRYVPSFVLLQVSNVDECLAARCTDVRLVAEVHAEMVPRTILRRKPLAACCADKI